MSSQLVEDATKRHMGNCVRACVDETGREWALMSSRDELRVVTRCECGCILSDAITQLCTSARAKGSWQCALLKEAIATGKMGPSISAPRALVDEARILATDRADRAAARRVSGGGSGLGIPDC